MLNVDGRVKLNFTIGRLMKTYSFFVSENIGIDMILGRDF